MNKHFSEAIFLHDTLLASSKDLSISLHIFSLFKLYFLQQDWNIWHNVQTIANTQSDDKSWISNLCRYWLKLGHLFDSTFSYISVHYYGMILKTSNILWSYLPTPPLGQDMTQGQIFKRSLTGLNSEFSFS